MENEGLLKRADGVTPYFYHLKSHKKAYNIFNYKHEKICADIYVHLQDHLDAWYTEYDPDFDSVGLRPDRQSICGGFVVMWEIDRSTMTQSKIIKKLEKYRQYANRFNREFIVVFACSDRRAKSLIPRFKDFKNRKVWFFTVNYKDLLNNPTGAIFNSPRLERVSLLHPNVPHEPV